MPIPESATNFESEANISDRVSEVVAQSKSKLTEFGAAAAEKFEENRVAAVNGLEGAAETIHQQAGYLPGGPRVTNLAHSAADKLYATADYMREHDLNRTTGEIENFVKRNPGPSLLIAAGLGFLFARSFSSGSRR